MAKTTKSKIDYKYASGRRRTASVRVRLHKGRKENLVNDIVIGKYFPGEVMREAWQRPFDLTQTLGKYYITARVMGGGKKGQLDGVVHATAKALVLESEKFKSALKGAGLLTRDSRIRERRKVGTGGKARRQKQSPKR
ncbi:MAG: 30S ribosomal protein S9 [Candidatus Woesebacteria bacterium GW2011_GWB1_38_5b]|uniref:Small ribosomal subunit protein uS9 n=1 Tax=Candidatus Woesebacteria bacterium GW2011_GWB1_38_5b TaxID=1618569 RepID=A0A0G0KE30_9BACT|nr:MAG: 30S ribosomal protein S9 [Candidatus Woesebacteria bacterium GW2011_GWB1_38_5b]